MADQDNHHNKSSEFDLKSFRSNRETSEGRNPTNLELIDLRAALHFSHGKVLAVDNYGNLKFIDRGRANLKVFDDKDYLWDWKIKLFDSKFKHMFWLSCGKASVKLDMLNRTLVLRWPSKDLKNSLRTEEQPAIMMVEPWSGHLHVFNHHYLDNEQKRDIEPWMKVCDMGGVVRLISPSSDLLHDLNVKPVTMTALSICTRDRKLVFNKRVMKLCNEIKERILNRQVASHSNVLTPD